MKPEELKARLQKIADKYCERQDEYNTTYRCPECQDTGFVLFERMCKLNYLATYSRPCANCNLGARMALREHAERAGKRKSTPDDDLPF